MCPVASSTQEPLIEPCLKGGGGAEHKNERERLLGGRGGLGEECGDGRWVREMDKKQSK